MDTKKLSYSNKQLTVLVILRILMGWYCLYEGVVKLINPDWTAAPYLMDSAGWFAGLFELLTYNQVVMDIVNLLNTWGLIAIGLGLLLGFMTRAASIAGFVLLMFYYLSHPPIIGADYMMPMEGNYLWVNKTLIEAFVFATIFVFPTSHRFGLDSLVFGRDNS